MEIRRNSSTSWAISISPSSKHSLAKRMSVKSTSPLSIS